MIVARLGPPVALRFVAVRRTGSVFGVDQRSQLGGIVKRGLKGLAGVGVALAGPRAECRPDAECGLVPLVAQA